MIRSLTKRRRMPVCKDVPAVASADVNAVLTRTGEWFCSKCLRKWPMREPHDNCSGTASDMDAVVTSPVRGCARESAANQIPRT